MPQIYVKPSQVGKNLSNNEFLQSLDSHAAPHDASHCGKSWVLPKINNIYNIQSI